MKTKWKLEGLKDLEIGLEKYVDQTKNGARKALIDFGKKLETDSKALFKQRLTPSPAPIGQKKSTGATIRAIKSSVKGTKKTGYDLSFGIKNPPKNDKGQPYPIFTEFGTGSKAGQHPKDPYSHRATPWKFKSSRLTMRKYFYGQPAKIYIYGAYLKNYKNFARFFKRRIK